MQLYLVSEINYKYQLIRISKVNFYVYTFFFSLTQKTYTTRGTFCFLSRGES